MNTTTVIRTKNFVVLLLLALVFGAEPGFAQKGPKGKRAEIMKRRDGDAAELGAARDKYEAWRRGVVQGDSFYRTKDSELAKTHRRIDEAVRNAMVEDRLTDARSREILDSLYKTGEKAKELRGTSESLSQSSRRQVMSDLEALAATARKDAKEAVEIKVATPRLNRIQIATDDLVRFGEAVESLSKGQLASVQRKVKGLEEDELRAKEDGEVSDRERENLIEDAQEIFRDLAKDLRS